MSSFLADRTVRWSFGALALCLVLLVAAWFFLVTPRRDEAALLREQKVNSDLQASQLEVKLAQLESQAKELPAQKKKLKEIAKELPPDADVPKYIRTLDTISTEAGVTMKSITPGTPVLVTLAASAGTEAAAASANTSGLGAPGDLVSLPMNLEIDGDYYQLSSWLKALQSKVTRSYLVNGFTLTSNKDAAAAGGLSGAQIADGEPSTPTASATATGKGQEGVVPTTTATATATDPSVVAPTTDPTATSTSGTDTSTDTAPWSLALTGTVFVLLTEDSTLEDVKADAAAAQASLSGIWTEVTPEPTATASATASATGSASATATDPNVSAN